MPQTGTTLVCLIGGPKDGEQLEVRRPLPRQLAMPTAQGQATFRQLPRCPHASPLGARPPRWRWLKRRRWDDATALVDGWWQRQGAAVTDLGQEVYHLETWAHGYGGGPKCGQRERFYRHSSTPVALVRACHADCCTGHPDGP